MGLERLRDERDCRRFIGKTFGMLEMLETLAKRLGDESAEFTADSLMWIHFDSDARRLRAITDDPQKAAKFRQLHAQYAHILPHAQALAAALERLHIVRNRLLNPHVRPDGRDVMSHKEDLELKPPFATDEDLARFHGITVDQLKAWRAQTDVHGFTHLTMAERNELRDAILQEFSQ